MKIVIVGGVAGGATAAARIRRLDENAEIIIFERSNYISYANCGLPYYIGETIENKEDLTIQTPESFYRRFNIDVQVNHEVIRIDTKNKLVVVKNLLTQGVFNVSYDKLILSTGAKPITPKLENIKKNNIFTLRTVEDTLKIKEYIDTQKPISIVIAGGGFIGLEVAENLINLGLKVTIVQGSSQLMTPFDEDMASIIHNEVKQKGVKLIFNERVSKVTEKDGQTFVELGDNKNIPADMVILAIGILPDTTLAKESGLKLGIKESIVVNEKMQTSSPDIYAVGDAVQIKHFVTKKDSLISLAGPANKQARVAADNICGIESKYLGSQGSSVIKIFDLTAATTGINERIAKENKIAYDKVILSPLSHAGYYPNAETMTMKVLFEKKTYGILGAQIIGYSGVDKRIDVLATAIRGGIKAYELSELDLSYAPPYSSAKDPVNMAGFMIENIKNGILKQWHYEDLCRVASNKNVTLLDTRTKGEYSRGHIDGFINIPVDELRNRLSELDKNKPVYVMCQSGVRSYIATRILNGHGFNAYNFSGGYRFYEIVNNDKQLTKTTSACGMDN